MVLLVLEHVQPQLSLKFLLWSQLLDVKLLRNVFSAGISVCRHTVSYRLSSGCWEPQAKGRELPTFRIKGAGTYGPARALDTQTDGRN